MTLLCREGCNVTGKLETGRIERAVGEQWFKMFPQTRHLASSQVDRTQLRVIKVQ